MWRPGGVGAEYCARRNPRRVRRSAFAWANCEAWQVVAVVLVCLLILMVGMVDAEAAGYVGMGG